MPGEYVSDDYIEQQRSRQSYYRTEKVRGPLPSEYSSDPDFTMSPEEYAAEYRQRHSKGLEKMYGPVAGEYVPGDYTDDYVDDYFAGADNKSPRSSSEFMPDNSTDSTPNSTWMSAPHPSENLSFNEKFSELENHNNDDVSDQNRDQQVTTTEEEGRFSIENQSHSSSPPSEVQVQQSQGPVSPPGLW